MNKKISRNWYMITYPNPHVDLVQLIEKSSIPNAISPVQPTKKYSKNWHNSKAKRR